MRMRMKFLRSKKCFGSWFSVGLKILRCKLQAACVPRLDMAISETDCAVEPRDLISWLAAFEKGGGRGLDPSVSDIGSGGEHGATSQIISSSAVEVMRK